MAIAHQTPYIRLHVNAVTAVLETEWLGFCNSAELRLALQQSLVLARRHRVRGWIGNNRQMRTIRPNDQDWINEIWFPEFARLGVQRLAVVVSSDALNQMGVDSILQRATAHAPFETHYFSDIAEARLWVSEAPDEASFDGVP